MKQKQFTLILTVVVLGGLFLWFAFGDSAFKKEQGELTESCSEAVEVFDPARIMSELDEGKAVLLDVRTEEERITDGYALGSTHFDVTRLDAGELPDIPKDMKIYTQCKAGGRAGRAKDILNQNGFSNVINIGGFSDWVNAGGPEGE